MHHIIWVDLTNGEFHDMYADKLTKHMIEHYEQQGFCQIFSVKEDVK